MADTFNIFVQHCTEAIRKMRYLFPSNDRVALSRLDFLLRSVSNILNAVFTVIYLGDTLNFPGIDFRVGLFSSRKLFFVRTHLEKQNMRYKYFFAYFSCRCLALACEMEAFKTVCPFEPDVRSEVSSVLKKGTRDWWGIRALK